jgi:outer membrane protein
MNKTFALAALALAMAAPVAHAQAYKAGDILARARIVNLDPAVTVNRKTIPEVDFTYFFSPNLAAELILTYPQKHDVLVNGGKVGTLKHLPPVISLQYHFSDLGAFKPYIGIGLNATFFSSVKLPAPGGVQLSIKKQSYGLSGQVGFDYALDKTWSLNVDVKKVKLDTTLYGAGTLDLGKVKVDPLLVGIGVGYKF